MPWDRRASAFQKVSKKLDSLILDNSGLIDSPELRETLSKAGAHFRILRLAYEGDLTGDEERFKANVFPRELDQQVDNQIKKLKLRLDELNRM